MVLIDYVIIAIISFSTLISSIRGFVREVLSLIVWGCAFIIAAQFYPYLAIYLTIFNNIIIRNGIAILILFIVILIIGTVVNHVISSLIERTKLSGIDRLLGVCFGLLRGILIVLIILFFLDTFTSLAKTKDWQHSEVISRFNYIIRWFFDYLKNTSSFLSENINLA
ncbi:MAG: CvpA family protein [Arsenophonus sp. ET-DL9-MAG3]